MPVPNNHYERIECELAEIERPVVRKNLREEEANRGVAAEAIVEKASPRRTITAVRPPAIGPNGRIHEIAACDQVPLCVDVERQLRQRARRGPRNGPAGSRAARRTPIDDTGNRVRAISCGRSRRDNLRACRFSNTQCSLRCTQSPSAGSARRRWYVRAAESEGGRLGRADGAFGKDRLDCRRSQGRRRASACRRGFTRREPAFQNAVPGVRYAERVRERRNGTTASKRKRAGSRHPRSGRKRRVASRRSATASGCEDGPCRFARLAQKASSKPSGRAPLRPSPAAIARRTWWRRATRRPRARRGRLPRDRRPKRRRTPRRRAKRERRADGATV